MPYYRDIDASTVEGRRTVNRLLSLREGLDDHIPRRTFQDTLLLATWNIRDFDKPSFGARLDESIYYIAEIIDRFDIVAVQEVYKDLTGLKRVMKVLGGYWKYVVSDTTDGTRGNDERLAFLYDTRKVKFGGLAGELVLRPIKEDDGTVHPATQLWRTPMMAGFTSGWTNFILATVHILWGGNEANSTQRLFEIDQVAEFLKERTEDATSWSRNIILLGDFNIFGTEDETFQKLVEHGFEVPEELKTFRSNAKKTRHYDQIALRPRPNALDLTGKAGVFDYFDYVFRDTEEDKAAYLPHMPDYAIKKDGTPRSERSKKNYYQTYWRTHQMSDHLPMWVEFKIDYSDEYLQRKRDTT